MSNMNNMLAPYGNYGYPYNNPFIPYYGSNIYNSPFLALPDPKTYNQPKNQIVVSGKGKKYNKNKKINEILNSTFNNMIPGLQSGVNLIFINSKFGNLIPGQSIQEENSDSSSSDDEDFLPKKKLEEIQRKKREKIVEINLKNIMENLKILYKKSQLSILK